MSRLAVFVLAACTTPHPAPALSLVPSRPPPSGDGGAVTAPSDKPPLVTVHPGTPREAIEAPHGAPISVLAVGDGGTSALTADELGGIRLWPALDGSREPRVVDLPRPRALGIGGHGDGFIAVVLDEVGGLVVAGLDNDGRTRAHVTLPVDPPYVDVAVIASGVLALRSDQIFVVVDPSSGITDKLAAEMGTRVTGFAVANGRAIAAVESAGKMRPRWLTLSPKLAWGAWVSAAVGDSITLSPSGNRIASLVGDQTRRVEVIDAAGKSLAGDNATDALGVGFADDDKVALGTANGVRWIDLSSKKGTTPNEGIVGVLPHGRAIFGAGGGHAVTAADGELVIATPSDAKFLGYELQTPAVAAAGPKGQLMIGANDAFALLDTKLRAATTPDLALPAGSAVGELRWLGGDDWLVESSAIADGLTALSLVDIAHKKGTVVKSKLPVVQLLMHEPSTHLVTLSLGEAPEIHRYDPEHRKLDKVASLPKPKGYEQTELVPVSPKLAGGTQLVSIHIRDRMKIGWVKDVSKLDVEASAITVDGSLAGVDAAGHVFVWQNGANGQLEVVIYRDGKQLGKLPTDGPTALWPEPAGNRVVELGQHSVAMYAIDGKRIWVQPVQGATEALWLDDGYLAVITQAGLARLDAATGAIAATRCGWRFGLSQKPHPATAHVEPVCALALDHL